MRILQINSIYKNGSTGRTTYEVERALIQRGHEPYIAFGYGSQEEDDHHIKINTALTNSFHKIMSRLTGLEGYYSIAPTIRLINKIKRIKPDIIHLRCLHGDYINLPILFKYLSTYHGQVFMNLHDCWDFTGHCPYFGSCEKWKTKCEKCDKYKSYPKSLLFDTSSFMYKKKEKWYSNVKDLHIIGVSKWLSGLAEESMLRGRDIKYLYNWIDQTVFNPDQRDVGEKDSFSVVFVSASWEPQSYRYKVLNKLIEMIPDDVTIKIVGIYVGEKSEKRNVEYLGYVSDIHELAKIYCNSDAYIHLSKEEAFGKVIAEANACGIPAIVFNVTGCAEVVSKDSGYRVKVDDIEAIVDNIIEIQNNGYSYYKQNAVNNVRENFHYETNVNRLIDMYECSIGN